MNENEAVTRVSTWLKNYGWKVQQDRKNSNENAVFHISGTSLEKPDLVIQSPLPYYGETLTCAVQMKIGESGRDLGKNSKIIDYFYNYHNKKTLYFDHDGNPIKINHFLVGSFYSPDGHLKDKEPVHINGQKKTNSAINGFSPMNEYEATYYLVRRSIFDNVVEKTNVKEFCGIGALLSTILDGKRTCRPAIFIKRLNKNNRWVIIWANEI
jgi:hypothetical protein